MQYLPIWSAFPIWGRTTAQNVSRSYPVFLLLVLSLVHDNFLRQQPYIYHFAVPILFGTYNRSTATTEEAELSKSLQTAFANFAKNPGNISEPPAPNWPAYEPGHFEIARIPTLAKIAYEGNVAPDDFVDPVQPINTVSTQRPRKFHLFIAEHSTDHKTG